MADVQKVKALLAEYGITSEKELAAALKKAGKIDIGVFAAPIRKEDLYDKYTSCIAYAG